MGIFCKIFSCKWVMAYKNKCYIPSNDVAAFHINPFIGKPGFNRPPVAKFGRC
jgi:hypothetical protein